jgi:hypothetical protein
MPTNVKVPKTDPTRVFFQLRNTRTRPTRFHLEPWGEFYDLAPQETVDVVATEATANGQVTVDVSDDGVTVGGWVRFFREGKDLAGK